MVRVFTCTNVPLQSVFAVLIFAGSCLGDNDKGGLAGMVQRDITQMPTCYTLLNDQGAVGCRTTGKVSAPVLPLRSQEDVDFLFRNLNPINPVVRRVVLLAHDLLTADNLKSLGESGMCVGLLVESPEGAVSAYSPADAEPYCPCGDESKACIAKWNGQPGNGVGGADVDFGIVLLDESSTQWLRARLGKNDSGITLPLTSPQGPTLVVGMDYQMDVFRGYRKSETRSGGWWLEQAATKCCKSCRPNCGSACCDTEAGYQCVSRATNPLASWDKPTCVKQGGPNSRSCLEASTCQPVGGYNVWSILAPSLPLPAPRNIIIVMARMDAAGMFHDAQYAAARVSGLAALLAAAHALSSVQDVLLQAPNAVLFLSLQAEAYGNTGSRRFVWDLENFACKKEQEGSAVPLCIDPLMLAPDVAKLGGADRVSFVLEIDQPVSDKLYWHSGCTPSQQSDAARSMIVGMQWAQSNISAVVESTPSLPFPPSSAANIIRAPGAGLLAGYDTSYVSPFRDSELDTLSTISIEKLCSAAGSVAHAVLALALGRGEGAEFDRVGVDCERVRSIATALSDKESSTYVGTAYAGVYLPPTLRGPSAREAYVHDELAAATGRNVTHICDCCDPDKQCKQAPYTSCVRGTCRVGLTYFHDALAVPVVWDVTKRKYVVNESRLPSGPIWTESNWQSEVGARGFVQDDERAELTVLVLGMIVALLSVVFTVSFQKNYAHRTKQS